VSDEDAYMSLASAHIALVEEHRELEAERDRLRDRVEAERRHRLRAVDEEVRALAELDRLRAVVDALREYVAADDALFAGSDEDGARRHNQWDDRYEALRAALDLLDVSRVGDGDARGVPAAAGHHVDSAGGRGGRGRPGVHGLTAVFVSPIDGHRHYGDAGRTECAVCCLEADRDRLRAVVEQLQRVVSFFASAIKSGEPWTETCEEALRGALDVSPKTGDGCVTPEELGNPDWYAHPLDESPTMGGEE
jgi:hypothetical protein